MENPTLSKRTVAFGLAVGIACVVNAIIVVIKEKSGAVMSAMKSVLGHHWTTHAALIVLLFFILGLALTALRGGRGPEISGNRLIGAMVSCVALAGLIIVGFYLFAD